MILSNLQQYLLHKKLVYGSFLPVCLFAVVMLSGCGDKETASSGQKPVVIRNKSRVIFPSGVQKAELNAPLKVAATAKDTAIDSMELQYNGKTIASSATDTITLAEGLNITGTPRLLLKVHLQGGKTEVFYPKFMLLPPPPERVTYLKTAEFPHLRDSYTQGLFFKDDKLYESTGQYEESKLLVTDLTSGKAIKRKDLNPRLFGEGMTAIGDSLYHITWKAGQAFIYDPDFKKLHTFNYDGEGWGLTNIGDTLVMSDGSNRLSFRDKNSFGIYRSVEVHDHRGPVDQLNELEYAYGFVWANVYLTNRIVKIDPQSGAVTGELDLTGIFPDRASYGNTVDQLNGIAYRAGNDRFYVTGKHWPALYEIKLTQR